MRYAGAVRYPDGGGLTAEERSGGSRESAHAAGYYPSSAAVLTPTACLHCGLRRAKTYCGASNRRAVPPASVTDFRRTPWRPWGAIAPGAPLVRGRVVRVEDRLDRLAEQACDA